MKNILLLFFLIGFLVYGNGLLNGFVWDDEEQVLNNTLVHSLSNFPNFFTGSTFNTGGSGSLAGMYYKPIMSTSFAFLYTIFGSNALFFHFFQLIIHILNSYLLFLIFRFFLMPKASFLSALIFLIHPQNSESVLYISALQDTLYFFFGIVSLLLAIKGQGLKNSFLVQFLLLVSLLSKETGILFFLMVIIWQLLFQKERLKKGLVFLPFSLGIYILLRFSLAGVGFNQIGPSPIMRASFVERVFTIPQLIISYLGTFIFPYKLAIAQHWLIKELTLENFILPLLAVILVIILMCYFLLRVSKKDKKPYLFFFIWFGLGLGLHLQIIPLDMTVAERWFYFPMAGLLGLLGIIIPTFEIKRQEVRRFGVYLLLGLIVTFSFRTIWRTFDWRNGLDLFTKDSQISQDSFDLENNLGVEMFRAKKFNEAEEHFKKSTELAPYWWTNWNNLGAIMERKNEYSLAEKYYQKAINQGNYYLAHENQANLLLFKKQNPQEAQMFSQKSLETLPLNSRLWLILSLASYKLNDKEKALQASYKAYSLFPNPQTEYVYFRLKQGNSLDL